MSIAACDIKIRKVSVLSFDDRFMMSRDSDKPKAGSKSLRGLPNG